MMFPHTSGGEPDALTADMTVKVVFPTPVGVNRRGSERLLKMTLNDGVKSRQNGEDFTA